MNGSSKIVRLVEFLSLFPTKSPNNIPGLCTAITTAKDASTFSFFGQVPTLTKTTLHIYVLLPYLLQNVGKSSPPNNNSYGQNHLRTKHLRDCIYWIRIGKDLLQY